MEKSRKLGIVGGAFISCISLQGMLFDEITTELSVEPPAKRGRVEGKKDLLSSLIAKEEYPNHVGVYLYKEGSVISCSKPVEEEFEKTLTEYVENMWRAEETLSVRVRKWSTLMLEVERTRKERDADKNNLSLTHYFFMEKVREDVLEKVRDKKVNDSILLKEWGFNGYAKLLKYSLIPWVPKTDRWRIELLTQLSLNQLKEWITPSE